MARDPGTGYKTVAPKPAPKPVSRGTSPAASPTFSATQVVTTMPQKPPVKPLQDYNVHLDIDQVNDKVEQIVTAHKKAVGTHPTPALIFDILKADPVVQKAGISYDNLFGVPKSRRDARVMQTARTVVSPIDPIATLPVIGARVPMPMTQHELDVQSAVSEYKKGAKPQTLYVLPGPNPGMVAPGNLDILHRKVAKVGGGIATVRSITIGPDDGKFTLLPTIIDGKSVTPKKAIEHYKATGENLGSFTTEALADSYAERLHKQQELFYGPDGGAIKVVTRGLPPDYGYTHGLGLAPGDEAQLMALADIGRPAGLVWKVTKQIIDTTASLPAGMVFMGSSIGADVRDMTTYGLAPLAEATNSLPLPGPQQHFKQRTPDFHRTRDLGVMMAKGVWYDVTHPYDQAGYLILDLFGGYSAAAGVGSRVSRAAAASGARASAKAFVKRPPPGYYELSLGGYSESIPMFNNAGARIVQQMVLKRRQKKLGDSMSGDMITNHSKVADLVFSSHVYLKRATDNKVAIQYAVMMTPSVEFTRLSGFRARAGIAIDALKSDPKLIRNLRGIGASKIAAMDKAVEIMFIDDPTPVITARNFHLKEIQNLQSLERDLRGSGVEMEAMTDQEVSNHLRNVSYQVENHKEQLRMIDVAESMIDKPIRQWPEYLRRARAVADAQEYLKKLHMGLDPEIADQAVAKLGAFYRRDPLIRLDDVRWGVVQPAQPKLLTEEEFYKKLDRDAAKVAPETKVEPSVPVDPDKVAEDRKVAYQAYLDAPENKPAIPNVKKMEQHVVGQTKSMERAQKLVKSAEAKLRAADARDVKAGKEPRARLVEEAAKQPPLGETPKDVRGRTLLDVEETLAVRRGDLVNVHAPEGDFRHLGNFKDSKDRIIGEYVGTSTPVDAKAAANAIRKTPGTDIRPATVTLKDGSTHQVNPLHPVNTAGDEVLLLDGNSADIGLVRRVHAGDGSVAWETKPDERVLVDLKTGEEIQRTKLGEKPKVVGSRPDEQVIADTRKHLKELERKHDKFFQAWREKMFGKETPEDKAEQLRRNNENAKYKRQQAGKNRADKGAGYSGKKVPSLQKTVKEEQNLLVDEAIDQFVAANADDPAVKTMLAERAEIQKLKDQLNPMPGEEIDANLLRAPDEPRPTAEELAGKKEKPALTHEEEALRRAQAQLKRAERGLAKATAEVEKVREAAKPLVKKMEESRYYPSRRRIYQEGARGPFRAGRKNKYGVGPPQLPASLRYRNDGISLEMGDRRYDTSNLLPEELMMTTKAATQIKLWHDLWESGVDLPAGTMTHPIRDIKNAPQHLKEMVTSLEHARITKENAENFTEGNLKELREWAIKETPEAKEDPHVRYVDDRMLMDYFTNGEFWGTAEWWRQADQSMSKVMSPINDPLRFLMIFATPAYLLNALGSSVTLLSEYGMGAAPNLLRAMNSSSIWDGEVTRLLDTLGGQTHTSALITERGRFAKSYQGIAEMWQLVTDRKFREAAVLAELKRAKVPYNEMSTQEFKDVLSMKDTRYEKEVIGASLRAQDAMLNFGKMSWPERAILRHLLFVYAFMRASTAWSIRFQIEHPIQSTTLAQAGKERAQQIEDLIGNVDEWFNRRGYVPVGKGLWLDPIQANMPGAFLEVAYPFMSLFRDTPYASIQDTLGPAAQIAASAVTGRDSQGRELPHSGFGRLGDTALSVYQSTPFGYAQARAEKRKKEKPLPPASVNPGTYNPQDAALNQERAALDLSPFELDSWWQTWGRNIGRSAVPYKIDEAALNARYWRTTKETDPEAYEQHQIDAVVGKGGMIDRMEQLVGGSAGLDVKAGVEMIMRVSLDVDKEANDWKKHHLKMPNPGPRAKGIWTIDSLLEQQLISPADAKAMKKEINDAPPRMQDALRIKAMLDNGGKAWKDWNAHVQDVNWFGKQSYADTVGMLKDDGVGNFDETVHAKPETKWRYGRDFLAWEEHRKQLVAQADKAGPEKKVKQAELIEFENESKPVKVDGVTFPSYAAMRYGKLSPAAQASHKLAVSMRPWESLNSFDRSLLTGDVNAEAARGWTALATARAVDEANLEIGKRLPSDYNEKIAPLIAKQLPAFGKDYAFSNQPLAVRLGSFKAIRESRFAAEWKELLSAAAARYADTKNPNATKSQVYDRWAREDLPQIMPWIKQQSKGFQAQLAIYEKDHPDFLKNLVKP